MEKRNHQILGPAFLTKYFIKELKGLFGGFFFYRAAAAL
jgi:hypothetical protein